jgi:hypothetical protein
MILAAIYAAGLAAFFQDLIQAFGHRLSIQGRRRSMIFLHFGQLTRANVGFGPS